jgi:aspartyl-tRNA(Asn)/glutamyl-tRNA(Gln) amidotransferase subunit A
MVEANSYHRKWLRERPHAYQPDTLSRLQLGARVPAADYQLALHIQKQFKAEMQEIFQRNRIRALLTPTLPRPPQLLQQSLVAPGREDQDHTTLKWNNHCMPFNLTGQPALSIPCGFAAEGLPIGLQIWELQRPIL